MRGAAGEQAKFARDNAVDKIESARGSVTGTIESATGKIESSRNTVREGTALAAAGPNPDQAAANSQDHSTVCTICVQILLTSFSASNLRLVFDIVCFCDGQVCTHTKLAGATWRACGELALARTYKRNPKRPEVGKVHRELYL